MTRRNLPSLGRKIIQREQAAVTANLRDRISALSRTTQAAHSTIAVGESDVPLVDAVDTAVTVGDELPGVVDDVTQAGDNAWDAWEKAQVAGEAVDEAHEAADKAVADALLAQQTADGKNTIYRQEINPVAPPEKPFTNGDLWYRTVEVDGVTRIADVNMWNGSEWQRYQQVASSLLVPGSVGNVLIEDGAVDARKMTVDALFGKVLRGNEIYGALIDGSKFRLSGLTDASTIISDAGTSLTSWSGQNGTTLALDSGVFETGARSIRGTRALGNDFGVTRQFPPVLSALTAWFRVRVATETAFTASLTRFNNSIQDFEIGAVSTPVIVPADTWTWVAVSGNAVTPGMAWWGASLNAVGAQPTSGWVDRFQLAAGQEDQRSIEITRDLNGSPAVFGFGSTRQQRFTLSSGPLDSVYGTAYGSLVLGEDNNERVAHFNPFGMAWGNKSGGALHGFVRQTTSYDGDLVLSAQGKNIRALSVLDVTRGMKASPWSGAWNDNKTSGLWYGSATYAGDPPGAGSVMMTIIKHEASGYVVQEALRTSAPYVKSMRVWDGTAWSPWQGTSSPGDTDWETVSVPGATGRCEWCRAAGVVYVRFDVNFSTAVPANGVKDPMVTLPVAPDINSPLNIYSQGSYAAAGFVENTGRIVFRNQHTASATRFIGTTQWLAS